MGFPLLDAGLHLAIFTGLRITTLGAAAYIAVFRQVGVCRVRHAVKRTSLSIPQITPAVAATS